MNSMCRMRSAGLIFCGWLTAAMCGCLAPGVAQEDVGGAGDSAMKAPRRLSPTTDTNVRLDNVRLSWIESPGATQYQIYLGVDTNPPLLTTVTGNAYIVRDLPACSNIYWRVVAVGATETVSSPTWKFATQCN